MAKKSLRIALALCWLAFLGITVPGCQRETAPRFVSSAEVLALTAELESGEADDEGDPEELARRLVEPLIKKGIGKK